MRKKLAWGLLTTGILLIIFVIVGPKDGRFTSIALTMGGISVLLIWGGWRLLRAKAGTSGQADTCTGGVNTAAQGRKDFSEARCNAKKVGSTHYIWRSVHDGARCERCANNDGRKFSWDKEPPGGHAGAAARCRCYPEAIIPRD